MLCHGDPGAPVPALHFVAQVGLPQPTALIFICKLLLEHLWFHQDSVDNSERQANIEAPWNYFISPWNYCIPGTTTSLAPAPFASASNSLSFPGYKNSKPLVGEVNGACPALGPK